MLSRRRFVAHAALAAAALPLASPLASAMASPRRADFRALRRGVGAFTGRGGTIGYLDGPARVAVDAQFPDSAQTFLDGLDGGAARGLDLLVNTHHHGDHTAGNAVLAPVAAMHVAHESVPGLQRAAASRSGDHDPQHIAAETFRHDWRTDVGDETLRLAYFGPAHTCGDAVVHFERANVVHTGDLVFNHRQPFIDRGAGASVAHWIGVLEAIHGHHSDDAIFVFGHAGEGYDVVGTRAELLTMRDFLTALMAAVEARKTETAADLEGLIVPGHDAWGPAPMRVVDPVLAEVSAGDE